jgi:hypothetical protein
MMSNASISAASAAIPCCASDIVPPASARCLRDRFLACRSGGMLLLKLSGFILEERARILEVSERHISLQLGQPWYRRWLRGGDRRRPIEVRIDFARTDESPDRWQVVNPRRSVVDVQLRPLACLYPTHDFRRRAESIRQLLRQHFVADCI